MPVSGGIHLRRYLLSYSSMADGVHHVLETLSRPSFQHVAVSNWVRYKHIDQHIAAHERGYTSLLQQEAREAPKSQWKE